jgi:hypothetical protein
MGTIARTTATTIVNSSTVTCRIQIRRAPWPITRAIVAAGSSHHEATLLLKAEGRGRFRSKLPRSDTVGRLPVTLGFTWTVHFFPTISQRPTSPLAFGEENCRRSRLPIRLRPATNVISSHRFVLAAVGPTSTATWSSPAAGSNSAAPSTSAWRGAKSRTSNARGASLLFHFGTAVGCSGFRAIPRPKPYAAP